jgi:RNA polymerase sigma factor (sigma-70 family)
MSLDSPSRLAFKSLLADALASLPKSEAEVLWLHHGENLSFEAIGNRLGVNRKSIRKVWAKGLKSLRRSLK